MHQHEKKYDPSPQIFASGKDHFFDHISSFLSSGPKGAPVHDFVRAIEDIEYLRALTRVLRRLHPNSDVSVLNASSYAQIVAWCSLPGGRQLSDQNELHSFLSDSTYAIIFARRVNHRLRTARQLREQDEQQPVRYKQRDDDEHADLTDLENVSGSDGDEDIYEIVD